MRSDCNLVPAMRPQGRGSHCKVGTVRRRKGQRRLPTKSIIEANFLKDYEELSRWEKGEGGSSDEGTKESQYESNTIRSWLHSQSARQTDYIPEGLATLSWNVAGKRYACKIIYFQEILTIRHRFQHACGVHSFFPH